ncbi:gamma interferon inducible lysosomal thiol reductase (GILT) domain-containing protein [Phthorimaea operculella]|nr:gamma interferon inducible lysosomal thiol reductase (GILT) domain-containing protein [Phthorimaea operculella]KAI5634289.1 gamma interferon inducible lysosomal thiol reductase (GILT) domain-containing protein [Phthorimaea operculella]KAI5634290.1 gamma interferon inducible lysosomal thiol reductase (GILT) domain-containing protein [Phthorimaea operculella]
MDRCCSQAGNNSKYFELGMEQHHSCLLGANANVMFAFAWYELNKMRALLVVCLVTMLCGVLAKNKKSDDSKVKIAVYYESLCPDSKKFITSQLAPVWRDLRGAVKVKLVPYGKATIQACILKDRSLQDTDKMEMVICLMGEAHPDKSVDTCLTKVGKISESDKLKRCAGGEQGDNLLASYGDKSDSVQRPLGFVPTIVINEKFDQAIQDEAFSDLKKVVCRVATNKPAACS